VIYYNDAAISDSLAVIYYNAAAINDSIAVICCNDVAFRCNVALKGTIATLLHPLLADISIFTIASFIASIGNAKLL
jgi:hypothetical protein